MNPDNTSAAPAPSTGNAAPVSTPAGQPAQTLKQPGFRRGKKQAPQAPFNPQAPKA